MAHVVAHPTPNPQAYKFTIEGKSFPRPVTVGGAEAAKGTPFQPLFAIPGVASVFATANFVTITKVPAADWPAILDAAKRVLERGI